MRSECRCWRRKGGLEERQTRKGEGEGKGTEKGCKGNLCWQVSERIITGLPPITITKHKAQSTNRPHTHRQKSTVRHHHTIIFSAQLFSKRGVEQKQRQTAYTTSKKRQRDNFKIQKAEGIESRAQQHQPKRRNRKDNKFSQHIQKPARVPSNPFPIHPSSIVPSSNPTNRSHCANPIPSHPIQSIQFPHPRATKATTRARAKSSSSASRPSRSSLVSIVSHCGQSE